MITIRDLLEVLSAESPEVVRHLYETRGDGTRRNLADKCSYLARSYRGDHKEFLAELRKQDILTLLSNHWVRTACGGRLLYAASQSADALRESALGLFRDGVVLERLCQDEESRAALLGDDSAVADEDAEEDDDEEDRRIEPEAFWAELAFCDSEAKQTLRYYQRKAVDRVLKSLDGERPQLLHLATGGGKTRVANEILVRWRQGRADPVLWITKDWNLLHQALRDLMRRHRNITPCRIGGSGRTLHPVSEDPGDVAYTTIQTLSRRLDQGRRPRASLVIWDECHWGEHGRAGRILTVCKQRGIPVLGLTATPRPTSAFTTAYSKTFKELVDEEFLARPIVETPRPTNVAWSPTIRGRFEDVTAASLNELACNDHRNACIVEHYIKNSARFGKAIVFACNIDHVERLRTLFERRGVAARGVHSGQEHAVSRRALEDFKHGAVKVLVNVEKLTHGIDVPDATSVFLCRPTTSDILFAQMIGRAARRDEKSGKTSFFIVEFTDNVDQHEELFRTAQAYFQGSFTGDSAEPRPRARPVRGQERARAHSFDHTGAPTWIPAKEDVPEGLRGLWYREGQTFGIEFELSNRDGSCPALGPEWLKRAEALRSRLEAGLPGAVAPKVIQGYMGSGGGKDNSLWNVEYDQTAGWEVTSRVLANVQGFIEADVACRTLEAAAMELGMSVSHRTGTHVHIGWLGEDIGELKRAIALARLFEPALGTLVAPSRLVALDLNRGRYDVSQPNSFCRPVSSVFGAERLSRVRTIEGLRRIAEADEARYVTFNIKPLPHIHTVEVRMHNGTLEARKILLWISLWQQLLWAAAHRTSIPTVPERDVIEPTGDIIALAREYLPDARQLDQQAFLRRLAARRAQICSEQWSKSPELATWVEASRRWSQPEGWQA